MAVADIPIIIASAAAAVTTVTAAFIALRREIRSVHTIVNQQRTDQKAYNVLLEKTLREHGVNVPVDQSVVPPAD